LHLRASTETHIKDYRLEQVGSGQPVRLARKLQPKAT